MKTLVTMMFVMVVALVAGCATDSGCKVGCDRAEWVDAPPALCAVGIAKGISTSMARKLAVDNGRQELDRQISVKVMGLLEQSAQQVVGANPGEITGHEYAEEITRTLHKQILSGSRASHYWEDCCKEGEWYALVTIDKEGLAQAANAAAKIAAEKILKLAEEKHAELTKKLDENLDKHFSN